MSIYRLGKTLDSLKVSPKYEEVSITISERRHLSFQLSLSKSRVKVSKSFFENHK